MKLYVAFSVNGTNCFLVAEKTCTEKQYDKLMKSDLFEVIQSRRDTYDKEKDGVKLKYTGLSRKDGEPLKSAPMVIKAFKELETEYGFKIVQETYDRFVYTHWKK